MQNVPVEGSVAKDRKIVLLSFVWMVAIVMYHAISHASGLVANISSDLRVGGVSYFFVVSGFYYARRIGEHDWYATQLKKRLRTLVVPYFIWCALGLGSFDFLREFGISCHVPAANPPLWYVKYLLFFCIMAPLFSGIVGKIAVSRFFWLLVLALLAVLPWIPLPLKFALVLSSVMFLAGMALSFRRRNGMRLEFRLWNVAVFVVLWLGLHAIRLRCGALSGIAVWPLNVYSSIVLMVLSWLVVERIDLARGMPAFVGMSFFVYCSHILVMRFCHPFSGLGLIGCVANGVIVVGTCVVSGLAIKKLAPAMYWLLTGNR